MLSFNTTDLGPGLSTKLPDFHLPDHQGKLYGLSELVGASGLLLGFIGDIWHPTSVRRILWLQRQVHKFALMGTPVALLIRDHPHTLYGFHSSSPLPVPFPLLADAYGEIHRAYQMEKTPGLLLVDSNYTLVEKWLMSDEHVWPRMNELVDAINRKLAIAS